MNQSILNYYNRLSIVDEQKPLFYAVPDSDVSNLNLIYRSRNGAVLSSHRESCMYSCEGTLYLLVTILYVSVLCAARPHSEMLHSEWRYLRFRRIQ